MKARHFFEVWAEAVRVVASERDKLGIPMILGEELMRTHVASRHGAKVAEEAVSYARRLELDTRTLSATGKEPSP